jgi:predicted HicB family RNase H-like nuclease
MSTIPERRQIGARIPEALYRKLRIAAAQDGKTIGSLVERAIRRFLARREREAAEMRES